MGESIASLGLVDLADRPIELDELLAQVVDRVAELLDAERGTLFLIDHARGELVSRAAHLPELAEIRLNIDEGVAGFVARTGATVNVPTGETQARVARRIDKSTGFQTRSLLAVPVLAPDGVVVGVLEALNSHDGKFSEASEEVLHRLAEEVGGLLDRTSLRAQLRPSQRRPLAYRFNHIVGQSPSMRQVFDRVARAARTNATVLLRGASGCGKEALARAVHYNSPRRESPFVTVDCTNLPDTLVENELFGHERGAFTDAVAATDGAVQQADGGTLFLDEIGDLTPHGQGKILRLLQERTARRLGSTGPHKRVDVRFVFATHRDLEADVASGQFRADLYYRIRVVEIVIPSLAARGHQDLDRLIDHFLDKLTGLHGRRDLQLSDEARARLHASPWRGNVRELQHCIEAAVVLAPSRIIQPEDLPLSSAELRNNQGGFRCGVMKLSDLEHEYARWVLEQCGGNRSEAARQLGIGRNTLARKLGDNNRGHDEEE